MIRSTVVPRCFACPSLETIPGVGESARPNGFSSSPAHGSGRGAVIAFSTFAPYWPSSEKTSASSPVSATTMNSSEAEPPMAPESAWTSAYSRPQRSKIVR